MVSRGRPVKNFESAGTTGQPPRISRKKRHLMTKLVRPGQTIIGPFAILESFCFVLLFIAILPFCRVVVFSFCLFVLCLFVHIALLLFTHIIVEVLFIVVVAFTVLFRWKRNFIAAL